jgi:hypothetical protein
MLGNTDSQILQSSWSTLLLPPCSFGCYGCMYQVMPATMSGLQSELFRLTGHCACFWPRTGISDFDEPIHATAPKWSATKLRFEQQGPTSRLSVSKTFTCRGNQVSTCTCGFQDWDFSNLTHSQSPPHARRRRDVTATRFN